MGGARAMFKKEWISWIVYWTSPSCTTLEVCTHDLTMDSSTTTEDRRSGPNTFSRLHLTFLRQTTRASWQQFRSAESQKWTTSNTLLRIKMWAHTDTASRSNCSTQHADPRIRAKTPLCEMRASNEVLYRDFYRSNFLRRKHHSVQVQEERTRRTIVSCTMRAVS